MASKLALASTSSSAKNQLEINDLAAVLQLLRRHGYLGIKCFDLGLCLGLYPATLNVIMQNHKGDIETCLRECLIKWLQKADDVEKTEGGPTIYSLISALRELGENGVADGIDMDEHPACRILTCYASDQSLLSTLPQLVIVLYEEKLIKETTLPRYRQELELLRAVKQAVCMDCLKLQVFAEILCKTSSTVDIGNSIIKGYREVYCSHEVIYSNNENVQGLKINLPKCMTTECQLMRLKLGDTMFDVGSIMMKNPQPPSLHRIKYALRQYNKAFRPLLESCDNIYKILELISDHTTLDDISVLEYFVDKFNMDEAKVVIKKYKEAVEEFKQKKLRNYLEEHFSSASPLECERITIVVDNDANDFTLKDVEALCSDIFQDLKKHIKLNVIQEGNSFSLTFSFSLVQSEHLISVVYKKIHALQSYRVKKLIIGHGNVYEGSISSRMESGLFKQRMVPLSVQMIDITELNEEERLTFQEDTDSFMELMRESDRHECEEELKQLKEIFKQQLELQYEKERIHLYQKEEEIRMIEKVEVLSFVDLHKILPQIEKAFSDSVSEVLELVQEATNQLKVISECDEVKQISHVKVLYEHLKNTIAAVQTYLSQVTSLSFEFQKKIPTLIDCIEKKDIAIVDRLIEEIFKTVLACKQPHARFLECCNEFTSSCDAAEWKCRTLAEEAETRQKRARRAGGATTAAVIAAGTTASILVGVFTFGAGLAAGLPLTLAATAAATTAAGATTVYLSHKYGKAAKSFRKPLGTRFQKLQHISMTQDIIKTIYPRRECVRRYELVDVAMNLQPALEESTKLFNNASRGLKIAEEVMIAFTNEVDEVFQFEDDNSSIRPFVSSPTSSPTHTLL